MNLLLAAAGIFLIIIMLSRYQTNKAMTILSAEGKSLFAETMQSLRWFTVISVSVLIVVFMVLAYGQWISPNVLTMAYLAGFFVFMSAYHLRAVGVFKEKGMDAAFIQAWGKANMLRLAGIAILVAAFIYYFIQNQPQ